jgi:hypothetical protein
MLVAQSARASGQDSVTAWLLGLEVQQRTFDTMSAGDSRPVPRGESGLRLSLDGLVDPKWGVALSAHFGGAWFDWSDPVYNITGRIEDAAWGARLGADRIFTIGAGRGFVGLGVEYGEARSWLETLGVQQDISDEGPTCFMTGGYVRLGAMTRLWRRMAFCAEASQSFYRAHASDPSFGTQYAWLGRSLALSAGVRVAITRGAL